MHLKLRTIPYKIIFVVGNILFKTTEMPKTVENAGTDTFYSSNKQKNEFFIVTKRIQTFSIVTFLLGEYLSNARPAIFFHEQTQSRKTFHKTIFFAGRQIIEESSIG